MESPCFTSESNSLAYRSSWNVSDPNYRKTDQWSPTISSPHNRRRRTGNFGLCSIKFRKNMMKIIVALRETLVLLCRFHHARIDNHRKHPRMESSCPIHSSIPQLGRRLYRRRRSPEYDRQAFSAVSGHLPEQWCSSCRTRPSVVRQWQWWPVVCVLESRSSSPRGFDEGHA